MASGFADPTSGPFRSVASVEHHRIAILALFFSFPRKVFSLQGGYRAATCQERDRLRRETWRAKVAPSLPAHLLGSRSYLNRREALSSLRRSAGQRLLPILRHRAFHRVLTVSIGLVYAVSGQPSLWLSASSSPIVRLSFTRSSISNSRRCDICFPLFLFLLFFAPAIWLVITSMVFRFVSYSLSLYSLFSLFLPSSFCPPARSLILSVTSLFSLFLPAPPLPLFFLSPPSSISPFYFSFFFPSFLFSPPFLSRRLSLFSHLFTFSFSLFSPFFSSLRSSLLCAPRSLSSFSLFPLFFSFSLFSVFLSLPRSRLSLSLSSLFFSSLFFFFSSLFFLLLFFSLVFLSLLLSLLWFSFSLLLFFLFSFLLLFFFFCLSPRLVRRFFCSPSRAPAALSSLSLSSFFLSFFFFSLLSLSFSFSLSLSFLSSLLSSSSFSFFSFSFLFFFSSFLAVCLLVLRSFVFFLFFFSSSFWASRSPSPLGACPVRVCLRRFWLSGLSSCPASLVSCFSSLFLLFSLFVFLFSSLSFSFCPFFSFFFFLWRALLRLFVWRVFLAARRSSRLGLARRLGSLSGCAGCPCRRSAGALFVVSRLRPGRCRRSLSRF